MKQNIKNYHKIQEKIDSDLGWYDKQLMRIDFRVEENIFNEKRTILNIDTKIANTTNNQIFLERLKFVDVRDLSLKEVNYSPIDRLIIQDMKGVEDTYSEDMRFYVHDDSGYGENDGYKYIAFYCANIEAVGLEEFPYEDF
ncbi:hypothetical protein AK914_09415 [Listeria monocytogenes]|uniref:Uncharacterized protein n=1 Tax=Listeria monocytogenes TaxID=1639 RepID=A0AAN2WJV6_LISMN|nr:hypothetical protein [Listeria monocytogenes]EAC3367810.1 hypothetical protein [Listeria monocytogenes]EAC8542065.1 hypothetical protein [Listeria monocytogenes]EAC8548067.1 hypothetical protein [Listeria monocytogenes]EAC8934595.1 hypothetical protein [Listeria monocytogenes]